MNVRYIEDVLMTIVIIAPYALLPETFHDIRLVLIILCITVLRGSLARQFSVEDIPSPLQREATALEILGSSILLLILALRVCAHLYHCY